MCQWCKPEEPCEACYQAAAEDWECDMCDSCDGTNRKPCPEVERRLLKWECDCADCTPQPARPPEVADMIAAAVKPLADRLTELESRSVKLLEAQILLFDVLSGKAKCVSLDTLPRNVVQ